MTELPKNPNRSRTKKTEKPTIRVGSVFSVKKCPGLGAATTFELCLPLSMLRREARDPSRSGGARRSQQTQAPAPQLLLLRVFDSIPAHSGIGSVKCAVSIGINVVV